MRWRWLAAAAAGVLASLQGCVLYDDVGPTSTELYALIDAHCSSATACACGWAGDEAASCTTELELRWNTRLREGSRRGLEYDAACTAALTAAIESYGCYWPGGPSPLCSEFCAVFHGDRVEGDACEGDDPLVSDCEQGLVCNEGTCASPCAVLGGRARGEVCGNESQGEYDDCGPGLWCSWSSGLCEESAGLGEECLGGSCAVGLDCDWQVGICVMPPTEGQPCESIDCADGLYCEWSYEQGTSACQRTAVEGEPCDQRQCADELYCNEYSRCVAAPPAGQSCLWGSICSEESTCDFDQGQCVARPEAGAPCVSGTCASGAWCSLTIDDPIGVCMPPQENGEMCSGHSQCQSRYCPNGFCWPAPRDGESCSETGTCAAGLVCNGTTCEPTFTRAPAACSYQGW